MDGQTSIQPDLFFSLTERAGIDEHEGRPSGCSFATLDAPIYSFIPVGIDTALPLRVATQC